MTDPVIQVVFVEHVFNVLENRLIGHVENVPHVIYSQPRGASQFLRRLLVSSQCAA